MPPRDFHDRRKQAHALRGAVGLRIVDPLDLDRLWPRGSRAMRRIGKKASPENMVPFTTSGAAS